MKQRIADPIRSRIIDRMISLPQLLSEHAQTRAVDRDAIERGLLQVVEGEVRFGRHDRMLYATDASNYQVEPIGVVVPASVADGVRAVRFCLDHGIAVLPRGGGTSLAGQCTAEAVVVDFSARCRNVIAVDEQARTAVVEPGVTIDDFNDQIRSTGLFFAPDPATTRHATVGGCIGNNAAGSHSVKYGRTSEHVLAIDALLGDGSRVRLDRDGAQRDPIVGRLTEGVIDIVRRHDALIRERFPRTIRRNAGYQLDLILQQIDAGGPVNLAPLLCGSEGTLAVTLGAEIALSPLPRAKGLAVVAFHELSDAIDAVQPILETGPSAVEMLDDMIIGLARANREYARYVDLLPTAPEGRTDAVLYVEYFAEDDPAELEEHVAELRRRFGAQRVGWHTDPRAMAQVWRLRKAGEPLLHGIPGNRKPASFVEDNAVPVERLGEFVERFRGIVARAGTRASFWAHASVGVLHVRPLLDLHTEGDRALMQAMAVEVADLAREVGGVMSGEHGDGRVRGPLLERFFGPELMKAFGEIKALFDPRNLFNPGNIVAPGELSSIAERLRVKPGDGVTRMPEAETFYRYDDQHGFRGAIEMCNGAGVCRKKQGGTMCPSYMATLDERHSTRGRGNALRLAITGQLEGVWNDAETNRTLDLCLSCKACKSECPSNVDIARLKSEYIAQQHRAHGTPLKARFFGSIRELNRLGSLTPGIANFVNNLPPSRWLSERLLGIDRRRSLPRFAKSYVGRMPRAKRRPPTGPGAQPRVVVFGDCFTQFNEPGIGRATVRALEAFGYEVFAADVGCCGRAEMSLGLLDSARRTIERTASRLRSFADAPGVEAVVFLEPSCHSAVIDDWQMLKTDLPSEALALFAKRSMLAEDFVASRWEDHPQRPRFSEPSGEVVFHGHCHQKALLGESSGRSLLERIAGNRVRALDSGCCGMAGSFGFDRNRYAVSMACGERVLLPAARLAAERGGCVVAAGTSCRHQVVDGAQVHALHPMEYLDSLIVR